MKIKSAIYTVLLAGLLFPLLLNCKKEAIKVPPNVTITSLTNVTSTSANSGGEVTSDGGTTVTERGVCWSVNQNPTTSDSKIANGTGLGSFTSSLTGLIPGTTYNIKAYAINSVGTGYSNQLTHTTLALAPVLTTTELSTVTATTATSGGNITNNGGAEVTARGVCWSTTENPTITDSKTTDGTGSGSFTSSITILTPGATYYFRAYATNSIGTAYGNQITIITTAILPMITTITVSAIAATVATSGGNITNDGGSAVIARGICWGTAQNPTMANSKTTNGTSAGTFTSSMTGLTQGTTYYARAYATNSIGTGYGNEVSFKTLSYTNIIIFNSNLTYGTVNDIDGNVYRTITIGTQTWMAENLKTTKYRNGDQIPNVISKESWAELSSGTTAAYCWYMNDAYTYKAIYGALYNWHAVADSRNIAPAGWHLPTDAEWVTLVTYLGGEGVAGGKLKETGTAHWLTPNTGATNSSGFTAVSGGLRDGYGNFDYLGRPGYWWSNSEPSFSAWPWALSYHAGDVGKSASDRLGGFSVRCLRD